MGTGKRSFSHSLAWTFVTNVAGSLVGLVTGILLAKLLGPEGRGALAAIQNWPMVFLGVGTFGITTAAAYFSGRESRSAGRLLTTCLVALFFWSIPLVAATYALMPLLLVAQSTEVISYARLYLLIIPIQFAIGAPFHVFQGLGEFKLWNTLRLQGPLAWLLVIGVAWMLNAVTAGFISLFYLFVMSCVACTFIAAAVRRIPPPYRPDFGCLPALLRYGLPSVLANMPQQLNLRVDQLLMAAFLPAQALGFYVVAVAWSSSLSPVLTSVSQVIFPRLAAMHDRQAQTETLQRIIRFSVLCAVALTVLLLLMTPVGLPLIFGMAFSAAVPAALVLVVGAGLAGVNRIVGEALRGMGLPKWVMAAEFVGMGFGISLLVILLPRYQLLGAAVASLAWSSATFVAFLWLISRQTSMMPGTLVVPRGSDLRLLWGSLLAFRGSRSRSEMETKGGR